MSELLQLDEYLFHLINSNWHTPFLDMIMPYWRSKYSWIPFYLILIAFLIVKYKHKTWLYLFAVAATIAIADTTSSQVIKKTVKRPRPCHEQSSLHNEVNLLIKCGGGYSFTSSHATNHFALAFFLIFTLGKRYRRMIFPLFLWATSIAFGQVYVGVHYPIDVFVGGLLGTLIGSFVAFLYYKTVDKAIPFNQKLIA